MFTRHTARTTLRASARPSAAAEALERRTFLAGNVTAGIVAATLELQGDMLGNQIKVWSGSLPNEVVVQGENGTTVNGSLFPQKFRPIEAVIALMGDGNDTFKAINLCLSQFDVGASLGVNGGRGDDTILVRDSSVSAHNNSSNSATLVLRGEEIDATSLPTTGNDSSRSATPASWRSAATTRRSSSTSSASETTTAKSPGFTEFAETIVPKCLPRMPSTRLLATAG